MHFPGDDVSCYAGIRWFLIAHGRMEASDLAMYALYIGIFISPIQILVELTEMMQKGLSGFRRFLEVVETEPDIVDAADAKPLKNVKGNVCYEDVSFHYSDDDTPVLSHVSFEIPAGKSIALVGPSGSGKTTICSLLPRFYDVTEGRVTIDGNDVRKLTLESLRSQIGLVSQDVYLFGGSIKDNIAYGKPEATMEEIVDAAKRRIYTILSWNCRINMIRLSERGALDCQEGRSRGFPLRGCSLKIRLC